MQSEPHPNIFPSRPSINKHRVLRATHETIKITGRHIVASTGTKLSVKQEVRPIIVRSVRVFSIEWVRNLFGTKYPEKQTEL